MSGLAPPRRDPVLLQLDARVWLDRLARTHTCPLTLADVPDTELDRFTALGLDWLYLVGVWSTGTAGRDVARRHPGWRAAFEAALPDLREDDICGSAFAVTGTTVSPGIGGDAALAGLRTRLAERGIRLMLDLVPNHTALDHPWATSHPERYIHGTEADLAAAPRDWLRSDDRILAHGRDPNLPGWPDTLQLDHSSPDVQAALRAELLAAASRCDGLRCDMAMLLLPEVFERTWGRTMAPFWPDAIAQARTVHPDLVLLAEVYWGLEARLLADGFDLAYDKRLYDRLLAGDTAGVRAHLVAPTADPHRLARFLENHDEPRITTLLPLEQHRTASLVTFLTPGLRFVHDGQQDGHRVHVPPHLGRGPDEPVDAEVAGWYRQLLGLLADPIVHDGTWDLLAPEPDPAAGPAAPPLAWRWRSPEQPSWLVVVNYTPEATRCRLAHGWLGSADAPGATWSPEVLLETGTVGLVQDASSAQLHLGPWSAVVLRDARRP